ncbi:hypothetical protein PG985_012371 [Apiospora marii]|uniref:uncharacterized protein n=1 Tax=Apiospora marii TaxID=335849 RepID=UPI00312E2B2D
MEASLGLDDPLDHDSIYTDLLEPDSIRLLELYPGPMRAIPLMGSLIVTTLRDCEADLVNRYTALSYVWGDGDDADLAPAAADTIILAGGSLKLGITANLSAALKDVRHTSEVMTVWIDAVCINQADVEERSRQVDLMGEIYRNAGSTIVYLGPLNPAVSLLFDIVVERKQQRMGLREDHSPLRDDGKQMATKEVGDDDDGSIGLLRRAVEEDLSAYPWFGRGWVFQELAPSKDPRIQCGERRLPWDDLLGVARPFLGRTEATRRLQALDAVHRSSSARSDKDLCSLILARRGSHVTDPRDLFFSLMGLASDRETYRKFLVPDYGKPARQVYIAAARYMKHKLGLSGFLHSAFARPAAKKSRALHLPSWVPDWEVQTIIPTAQETEETKSEPTVSSSEPLDKGALLLVEQIEEFGKVERLTDAFQRGASCFPHN